PSFLHVALPICVPRVHARAGAARRGRTCPGQRLRRTRAVPRPRRVRELLSCAAGAAAASAAAADDRRAHGLHVLRRPAPARDDHRARGARPDAGRGRPAARASEPGPPRPSMASREPASLVAAQVAGSRTGAIPGGGPLLGRRYRNDGLPLLRLNPVQRSALASHLGKLTSGAYALEHADCPICGPGEDDLLSEKDRYGIPMRVVICRSCGLIRTTPRLTPEAFAEDRKSVV